MKMFGKNEDRVIDNLLRANTRGRNGAPTSCREFDPDLANAYIERSLTASEQAVYERHLSECPACRSSVVQLARIAASESAPSALVLPVREESRLATLKGLFTASVLPRVAAAALAVIVLAISIPLLISRNGSEPPSAITPSDNRSDQLGESARNLPVPPQPPASGNETAGLLRNAPQAIEETSATTVDKEKKAQPAQDETALAKQPPAEPESAPTAARAAAPSPPQTGKLEVSRAAESTDQERRTESDARFIAKDQQPATAAPPPPASEQKPLEQINANKALSLPKRDNDAASITIRQGQPGGVPGVEKERTIRPDDTAALQPRNEAGGSGTRSGLAAPSPRARRDGEDAGGSASARGSNMRKVGSKKFWLSNDTWIDKDYNPSKEMPVVTVERDSDIYKELLVKRSGLKLYLVSFGEGERAIVVYKGTVYKLVPQKSR